MDILAALTAEFHLRAQQVENTVRLLDDGNTIPFIARYRKEMTGSLDDQVLRAALPTGLGLSPGTRRAAGRRSGPLIEDQGKLTGGAGRSRLDGAATLSELEDLYRPFRPQAPHPGLHGQGKGAGAVWPTRCTAQATDGGGPVASWPQAYAGRGKGVAKRRRTRLPGASAISWPNGLSDDADTRRKRLRVVFMAQRLRLLSKAVEEEDAGVYRPLRTTFKEPLRQGRRPSDPGGQPGGTGGAARRFQMAFDRGRGDASSCTDAHVREGAPAAASGAARRRRTPTDRLLFPSLERELRTRADRPGQRTRPSACFP